MGGGSDITTKGGKGSDKILRERNRSGREKEAREGGRRERKRSGLLGNRDVKEKEE